MLIDEIKAANVAAMKAQDKVAKGILSIIITKYKNLEIELKAQGKEIGDKDLLSIIQNVLLGIAIDIYSCAESKPNRYGHKQLQGK